MSVEKQKEWMDYSHNIKVAKSKCLSLGARMQILIEEGGVWYWQLVNPATVKQGDTIRIATPDLSPYNTDEYMDQVRLTLEDQRENLSSSEYLSKTKEILLGYWTAVNNITEYEE